jgi:glycosyltransferase involved in cell wall biosynthesis
MRILKIVQSYFPFQERGGTVFKVRAVARALAQRGHEVSVLTADLGIASRTDSPGRFERSNWGWQSVEEGVAAIYLPTLARYRALTVCPRVVRFCGTSLGRFDVAHVYGVYDLLGPVAAHYCERRGVPYVLEPMGMYRPIVRNLALKKMYRRILGKRLAAGARFVIATSAQEQQELLDAGVDRRQIAVRRNGVDGPEMVPARGEFRRAWNIPETTRIVLFLGRIVTKKRPDLLLEAFAGWSRTSGVQKAVLVIAGPDERDGFLPRLKSMADLLGIASKVLFIGPLYGQQKWRAYRDADVFVLPSENENFGNTAGEAVLCGTPVIVTDRCGVAPLVQSAGLIIGTKKEELERALGQMFGDEAFYECCRAACHEAAKDLSWDRPIEECERLYAACVSNPMMPELVA